MKASGLESYLEAVRYQSRPRRGSGPRPVPHQPVVTISREAGSGAHIVGETLVALLQTRARPGSTPWTMFDRELVERVLKDHELPERLARYMPEDRVSAISDTLDELFGVHPATRTLVRATAETILRLAEIGHVVLIGRGACVITSKRGAFHVRLVGSVARRIEHVQTYRGLGPREAAEYVRRHDEGRKRYLREYYGKDIDDPLLYHLVINTDRVPYPDAARMIADAVSGHPDEPGRGPNDASAEVDVPGIPTVPGT